MFLVRQNDLIKRIVARALQLLAFSYLFKRTKILIYRTNTCLLRIIKLKFTKVSIYFLFSFYFMIIDHLPKIFHKWKAHIIIIIFIIIKDAVAVAMDHGTQHEFHLIIKVGDIG